MSEKKAKTGSKAEPAEILDFIARLGQGGAEIIKGIYATPWTGIPFTLILLGSLEATFPGVTQKFLDGLNGFFNAVAQAAAQAASAIGKGLTTGPLAIPQPTATAPYCVRLTTLAGVSTDYCYADTTTRDEALTSLKQRDFLGLYTVTPFTKTIPPAPPGTTGPYPVQYCVNATGFLNQPANQCFNSIADRQNWVLIGVSNRRIANPQLYTVYSDGSQKAG